MKKKQTLNRVYLFALSIMFLIIIFFITSSDAKDIDKNEFTFAFFGDVQDNEVDNRYIVFESLLKKAVKEEKTPEFLLFAGDITDDGDDENQWIGFKNVLNNTSPNMDFYTCVGNHDDTLIQQKYFDIDKYKNIKGDNSFYSFDYKNTHFTVMDSNLMGAVPQKSIDWLENDLKNTDAKFKIAVFHHPAYPASNNPKDMARANTILENYIPIMEKNGVNLILNGHQHMYMRTYPMRGKLVSDDGIIYMMLNSSTKKYSSTDFEYIEVLKENKAMYSIITINDESIYVQVKDSDGNLEDSFEIEVYE